MTTDEQHLEWLKKKLGEFESEVAKAEATITRLQPAITHLKEVIQVLESEYYTPATGVLDGPRAPSSRADEQEDFSPKPQRKPSHMPKRQLEYQNMTALTALTQVLEANPHTFHADELVHRIFEIRSRGEFDAAKRAVVSELVRGANRGRLQKLGGNRFASKSLVITEQEAPDPPLSTGTDTDQQAMTTGTQVYDQSPSHVLSDDSHREVDLAGARDVNANNWKQACIQTLRKHGPSMRAKEIYRVLLQQGRDFTGFREAEAVELLASTMRASIHRNEGIFAKEGTGVFRLSEQEQHAKQLSLTRSSESDTVSDEALLREQESLSWKEGAYPSQDKGEDY